MTPARTCINALDAYDNIPELLRWWSERACICLAGLALQPQLPPLKVKYARVCIEVQGIWAQAMLIERLVF